MIFLALMTDDEDTTEWVSQNIVHYLGRKIVSMFTQSSFYDDIDYFTRFFVVLNVEYITAFNVNFNK